MTLMWRKQLAIGDKRIDDEHKYLICLINTVELIMRTGDDRELLVVALDQLDEYTQTHFSDEESIMLSIGYGRFDQHKIQHQLLIKELAGIRKQIEGKSGEGFSAEETAAIATLFRHWLLDHIAKEDMQLKPALGKG